MFSWVNVKNFKINIILIYFELKNIFIKILFTVLLNIYFDLVYVKEINIYCIGWKKPPNIIWKVAPFLINNVLGERK
jgi:hypothetical protein